MPDMSSSRKIHIGGASGYWGESDMAVPQFLDALDKGENLDYIVFDYLAEITMSILARQKNADPSKGYAADFIHSVLTPHLPRIAKHGVKLIANAGGVNPQACGELARAAVKAAGLDLKVAVISGDDLSGRLPNYADTSEMFSGERFPPLETIASANAYLGAFPIARALAVGADIIITGRVVDSAVTLGACIHEFGWDANELDKLASGSLAGHIIECGPQVTGGNFTDWEVVADSIADIGYPIAAISDAGSFEVSKPTDTGGLVSVGTVAEQMLYEIGDPQAYYLPDVICDFSDVTLEQVGPNKVAVSPAKGRGVPDTYKACATYNDGWKIVSLWLFVGDGAHGKGEAYGQASLKRAREKLRAKNLPDFTEASVEFFGNDSHYGEFSEARSSREVVMKLSAKHADKAACALLYREATGLALATPTGLAPLSAARPKPSPVVRLFSFKAPKEGIQISIDVDGQTEIMRDTVSGTSPQKPTPISLPEMPATEEMASVPLSTLAYGRSGDKGNKANIGIMPRRENYAPYIWAALSEDEIKMRFAHFNSGKVERFFLPGTRSMNILLHESLGGGGMASMRFDPQGKSYAQILLQTPIPIPARLLES